MLVLRQIISPPSTVDTCGPTSRISTSCTPDGQALLEQICELAEENEHGPLTFFFDEIQHVANWQKWINSALEKRPRHTFVVTGSTGRLLGGELATSLTGRHLSTELFPFDLDEFRRLHGQPVAGPTLEKTSRTSSTSPCAKRRPRSFTGGAERRLISSSIRQVGSYLSR
ncbi:MAG: hypothetical protein DRJ61_03050 [Acidobacteria bacterium]|nr:MAG: hypothetical protein DRJ61_03050 [Acidobacteriota bacterium]